MTGNYFSQEVSDYTTFDDQYSIGVEIEFYSPDKYYRRVHNKFHGILGMDGADFTNLGEFRSPVFHSKYPFTAFRNLVEFTEEIVDFLKVEDLVLAFCPHIRRVGNIGIHFSIGGRFIDNYTDILNRSVAVQEQLKYRYLDQKKFQKRENGHYKGDFKVGTPVKFKQYGCECSWGNGQLTRDNSIYINGSDRYKTVVEFRFFPSCEFKSIEPHLYHILFGGVFPVNEVVPFYKDGKFYE